MLLFGFVTICGPVGRYQRFGGIYCLQLQGFSHYSPEDEDSMFVRNANITRRYNPEDRHRHLHNGLSYVVDPTPVRCHDYLVKTISYVNY
jgi:hypothetical protein